MCPLTARASVDYQLTDENLEIVLPYPIYRLDKVIAHTCWSGLTKFEGDSAVHYDDIDITDRVLSETEYNTLKGLLIQESTQKKIVCFILKIVTLLKG